MTEVVPSLQLETLNLNSPYNSLPGFSPLETVGEGCLFLKSLHSGAICYTAIDNYQAHSGCHILSLKNMSDSMWAVFMKSLNDAPHFIMQPALLLFLGVPHQVVMRTEWHALHWEQCLEHSKHLLMLVIKSLAKSIGKRRKSNSRKYLLALLIARKQQVEIPDLIYRPIA